MANKMKPSSAAVRGIVADDLKRVVKDINKHREKSAENAGLAGQATKQAIELYNLDRAALGAVVRLTRTEPSKAQSTLRGIIEYADKLGMFDHIDMFDDLIPTLEGIVLKARSSEGKKQEADPVLSSLLGGAPGMH